MKSKLPPFLRWAGGKRWLAPYIAPAIVEMLQGRYIEPFIGSGAMFFAVQPSVAILGDVNQELINVYQQVANDPALIENELAGLLVNKDVYYAIRSSRPDERIERAVRFIYLNRTCFGGLHRTNQQGDFNVPYGGGSRTPEVVYRDHLLVACSRALREPGIELVASDFEALLARARIGDVVFCDPTYRAVGRGRFDRYGPTIFSWTDQIRLARAACAAHHRGATVIVMNADDVEVAALYGSAKTITVEKVKCIGNHPSSTDRHREAMFILAPNGHAESWAKVSDQLVAARRAPQTGAIRPVQISSLPQEADRQPESEQQEVTSPFAQSC